MSKDLYIRLLSVGQELLYFLPRHCQPIFIKRGRIIECKLEYTSTIRCAAKQWPVSIIFIQIFSYARARKKRLLGYTCWPISESYTQTNSGNGFDIFVHCCEIITYRNTIHYVHTICYRTYIFFSYMNSNLF